MILIVYHSGLIDVSILLSDCHCIFCDKELVVACVVCGRVSVFSLLKSFYQQWSNSKPSNLFYCLCCLWQLWGSVNLFHFQLSAFSFNFLKNNTKKKKTSLLLSMFELQIWSDLGNILFRNMFLLSSLKSNFLPQGGIESKCIKSNVIY